jgi:predicted porin
MSHATPALPRAAALATLLAASGSCVLAQSSVTIFGTLDVSVRQVGNGSLGSVTSEVSDSNRTSHPK